MLSRNVAAGRLQFTTSFAEAAKFAAADFLGVATPGLPAGSYDLSQLRMCRCRAGAVLSKIATTTCSPIRNHGQRAQCAHQRADRGQRHDQLAGHVLARELGGLSGSAATLVTAPTQTVNGKLVLNTAIDGQLWTAIKRTTLRASPSSIRRRWTPRVVP